MCENVQCRFNHLMTHLLRKINRIIDICEICFYILFELYIISSFRHAVQFSHFFSFPAVIVFKIAGVENDPFSFPFILVIVESTEGSCVVNRALLIAVWFFAFKR